MYSTKQFEVGVFHFWIFKLEKKELHYSWMKTKNNFKNFGWKKKNYSKAKWSSPIIRTLGLILLNLFVCFNPY